MGRKRKALATSDAGTSKSSIVKPRRVRGNRGKLEDLPNMPLDIIFEVMSYLLPLDLLHLSRTNKPFRRLLMVRSASPLWRAARKNVEGLPSCPQFLSEPAYANLCFDTHCNSCLKPGIKSVMWDYRVRYCPSCRKEWLVSCKGKNKCFFSEKCDDGLINYMRDISGKFFWHHLPEVSRLEKSIATMDDEAIAHQRELIEESRMLANKCDIWYEGAQDKRQQEIHGIRELRLQSIVSKLRELGWGDELDHMHPEYTLIRQSYNMKPAKELTERMWQNMRQDMVEFMERRRDWRLAREKDKTQITRGEQLRDLYIEWWRKQPNKIELALAVDIVCRPDMVALIQAPVEQEVDFTPYVEQFPDWAQEWRNNCDEELRKIIRNSDEFKDKIPPEVDPISLAIVAFTCAACSGPRLPSLYPLVLGHMCTHDIVRLFDEVPLGDPEFALRSVVRHPNRSFVGFRPWSAQHLKLGVWHQRAIDVVELCGQDPWTTTREAMDALPTRIWCESCEAEMNNGDSREVLKWRSVFAHHAYHDQLNETRPAGEKSEAKFKCITGKMADDLVELERQADAIPEDKRYRDLLLYACSHCQGHMSFYDDLEDHLYERHDIEVATDEDFYKHPDGAGIDGRAIYIMKSSLLTGADNPELLKILLADEFKKLAGKRMFLYDY